MRPATLIALAFAPILLAGCASYCPGRSAGYQGQCEPPAATPVHATHDLGHATQVLARVARGFEMYDGANGNVTTIDTFIEASKDADLVAVGELHGHPVGAAIERAILERMASGSRPVALAMEFFERDVQPALDDYLTGKTTEAQFLKATRQGPSYSTTHRPLIEFAKAHQFDVIAANAPRRLVTEYRKGEKPYAEYLASLSATDRGYLPSQMREATGPYLDRFMKLMGPERGSKLMKAQSLWDDAMAETIAAYRTAHPRARVLFVVGGFHVAGRLGTLTKFSARRPSDHVRLLVMSQGVPPELRFDPDDRGEGDAILTVVPIADPSSPAGGPPAKASQPATKGI